MKVLLQSEHARLEQDELRHIVRYTRSRIPFATVEDAANAFRSVGTASFGIDRSKYGLLSDVREAPGRNDPAFEAAIAQYRNELFAGFRRRATLVRTVAGALQVQRINREQHSPDVHVFHDEAEAIAYLTAR
jgi:hypothetical protein